jgi:arylformamidase
MSEARIVDLSYPVRSDMVVFPGMRRPVFRWLLRVNSEGANLTRFEMTAHTGTHVDAPMHFLDGVPGIDEVALRRLFGPARMYRSPREPQGQEIGLQEVLASGFRLEEDCIFVLATGIERYAGSGEYNRRFPNPSTDLLRWLLERRVRAYMTDAPAIDPVGSPDSPNHHLVLGAGVPIVENLRNLAELPENRPFLISALPILLEGREGAPCRAVALPDVEKLGT